VHAAHRDAHTRAINRHSPTQRCAVTQQPQRNAVQRRTRDNTKPQSQYCGTAPYTLETAPTMRAFYIARMTQPRFLACSQAQCTPHAHAD
jgi:hypothetical protein